MRALEYGINFGLFSTAAIVSASPKPYVFQSKEEFKSAYTSNVENRQPLNLTVGNYSNDLITLGLGLAAGYSLIRLIMSLDNKPIIQQPAQPINQPQQFQSHPITITNANNVVVRSPQSKAKSAEETYTPDRVKNQDKFAWLKKIYGSNCLMLFGGQGSGKSNFVEWFAQQKLAMGQDVIILDPHKKYSAWKGLTVVGGGRNYKALDVEIKRLEGMISSRYEDYSDLPDFNPRPITVICEEFSKWKNHCANADPFFLTSLTDCRKVKFQIVYVSHMKTMSGLTGQKGLSDTFKTGVDTIELIAETIECNDGMERSRPSGKGYLKLTGEAKPFLVDIPSYDPQKAIGNDSDDDTDEKSIADELSELFPDLTQDNNVIPLRRTA